MPNRFWQLMLLGTLVLVAWPQPVAQTALEQKPVIRPASYLSLLQGPNAGILKWDPRGSMVTGANKEPSSLIVLHSSERVFSDALFLNSVAAAYSQETKSFYILSASGRGITVYSQAGKLSRRIASFMQAPNALTVDSRGYIYIADSTLNQIRILGPTGEELRSFPAPNPVSLAVLSNGIIVVASPVGGKLLHTYDLSGRKLGSFGQTKSFDSSNDAQNRFLNQGKVLIDSLDNIYYVFQYAPTPTVQKFSKDGSFISEFAVEGYSIDLQKRIAQGFFDTKAATEIGGIAVITSAAIDPVTNHLWIGMNGSSRSGVLYEYDPHGRKVHEYALVSKSASVIIGVRCLIVMTPSIYIFAHNAAYRFDLDESRSDDLALLQQQEQCPPAQDWPPCTTNCGTTNAADDKDCKAALQQQINQTMRVISSSCTQTQQSCDASVTTCNPQTGEQVVHSITLTCMSGGSGGNGCDWWSEEQCLTQCGNWNSTDCTCRFGPGECASEQAGCNCSPVILDVLGNGFELTNAAAGVHFDLNGNGHAGRLSWTAEAVDDAFLALDRDGNGRIDNGTELFGNYTPQPPSATPNGFLALAEFDKHQNGGNGDGRIDRADAVWTRLRLWQDSNHNGLSEPSELLTLSSRAVAAIELTYHESKRRDRWGNEFRYRARVFMSDGTQRWAWDVFLISKP